MPIAHPDAFIYSQVKDRSVGPPYFVFASEREEAGVNTSGHATGIKDFGFDGLSTRHGLAERFRWLE